MLKKVKRGVYAARYDRNGKGKLVLNVRRKPTLVVVENPEVWLNDPKLGVIGMMVIYRAYQGLYHVRQCMPANQFKTYFNFVTSRITTHHAKEELVDPIALQRYKQSRVKSK